MMWMLAVIQPSGIVALTLGVSLSVTVGVVLRDRAALRGPLLASLLIIVSVAVGAGFFGFGQNGGEGLSNPVLSSAAFVVYLLAVAACLGVGMAVAAGARRLRRSGNH